VLAIFRAEQSETGYYIAEQIRALMRSDLNLSNKIHCIVTDEGKNFLNRVESLQQQEIVRESVIVSSYCSSMLSQRMKTKRCCIYLTNAKGLL
jgi:tRNA isopentenyl-2-thiomethyl-A-37 hydroxylase MiaE